MVFSWLNFTGMELSISDSSGALPTLPVTKKLERLPSIGKHLAVTPPFTNSLLLSSSVSLPVIKNARTSAPKLKGSISFVAPMPAPISDVLLF